MCGNIQNSDHDISKVKYRNCFISQLIVNNYYLALPMYRMNQYQTIIGVLLPDLTQWRLLYLSYHKLLSAFTELERHAASSSLFHYNDTRVRILCVIKDNKFNSQIKRTGQYTTVVITNSK